MSLVNIQENFYITDEQTGQVFTMLLENGTSGLYNANGKINMNFRYSFDIEGTKEIAGITYNNVNMEFSFKWDDKTGMGMAKYDKSKKSITFDLDREDADFYGMENLVFVKVDE